MRCVLVLIFTFFASLFKDHSPDSFKDTMVGESTLEKISNSSFKMELVSTTISSEIPIAFSGWQLGDKIQYSWQLSQIPVFQSVPNFWGTNSMKLRFVKDSLRLYPKWEFLNSECTKHGSFLLSRENYKLNFRPGQVLLIWEVEKCGWNKGLYSHDRKI